MRLFGLRLTLLNKITLSIFLLIGLTMNIGLIYSSFNEHILIKIFFWFFGLFALFTIISLPFSLMVLTKQTELKRKRTLQVSKGRIRFNNIDFDSVEFDIDHLTILADGQKRKFYYYHLITQNVIKIDKDAFEKYTGRK